MSLIRSFIPEDDYGNPAILRRLRIHPETPVPQPLAFGKRPVGPVKPRAIALECVVATQTFNTGQRLLGVPWHRCGGHLHFLVFAGDRPIYVPFVAFRPLNPRNLDLFPHLQKGRHHA